MATASSRRRVQRIDTEKFDEPPFDPAPEDGEKEESAAAPATRRRRRESSPANPPVEQQVDEDEDDEVQTPPRSRRRRESVDDEPVGEESLLPPIARGRKEIKDSRPQSEASLMYFRWGDDGDPQVVKFFDEEPWSYNQHWVTREGKQSFPCIARPGVRCPLCEVGVKSAQKIVYSLINLSHKDGPLTQVLEVGPSLDDTLIAYDEDRKTGPLPRLYWALSRTKGARSSNSRAKYNYLISPVKERDLEEDWEFDLDEVEKSIKGIKPLDPTDVLGDIDRKTLQEVADEVMGH